MPDPSKIVIDYIIFTSYDSFRGIGMSSKLLQFQNRSQPFSIKAKSATKAEIVIYASIGSSWFEDSLSAKQFSDELKALDPAVNELHVRINSPGGDVFDGVAIYNRLKQHSAKKIVYIDGLCASIASIIALAGDEIIMGEGALYMIHLPWTYTMGDRNALENTVQRLMDIEEQMISIYAKRSNLGRSEIRKMLEDETWLDADQAIEHGFVDSKTAETQAIAASVLDMKWLSKAPRNIKTQDVVVKSEVAALKNKIEGYLNKNKK